MDQETRVKYANGRSSDEIRRDIASTRGRVDETLSDIGDRLHPRSLLEDLWDLVRSPGTKQQTQATARRVAGGLGRAIRRDPGPVLLAGAAAAWALYNLSADDGDELSERARRKIRAKRRKMSGRGDVYASGYAGVNLETHEYRPEGASESFRGHASQASSDLAGEAQRQSGELVDRGRAGVERVRSSTKQGIRRASQGWGQTLQESPLLLGAGFLAAGVLAGALLPRTRSEDEWMGEASDRVTGQARQQAEELWEEGKEVAAKVGQEARQEAENRGLDPRALLDKANRNLEGENDPAPGTMTPKSAQASSSTIDAEADARRREQEQRSRSF